MVEHGDWHGSYPAESRMMHAAKATAWERRRLAAEYIEAVTGCAVPHATDGMLRAALWDGVVLCQLANVAFPGSVQQVRGGPPRCNVIPAAGGRPRLH